MPPQSFGQALFSKFFSRRVEGFGDAVGVEGDRIPAPKPAFPEGAIPFLEESQNGASGVQLFHGSRRRVARGPQRWPQLT